MNALFKPMIILQNGFDLMIPHRHSTVSMFLSLCNSTGIMEQLRVPQYVQHWNHGACMCLIPCLL
ncbi:hypothetical protein Peur_020752 [Populus x canadensis]